MQAVICVSGNPVFEFCMQLRLAPSAHLVLANPLTLTDPAALEVLLVTERVSFIGDKRQDGR